MDILFCDRCRESIPDADLAAGRAVRVGPRLYHVPCAFSRALPGPARIGLFLLALYAAGVGTYALVRTLERDGRGDDASAAASSKATADELALFRRDVEATLARERLALQGELQAAVAAAQERGAKAQAGEIERQFAVLQAKLEGYSDVHIKRFESDEAKIAELAAWVKEVRDLASRLQTDPSVTAGGPAPTPGPTPAGGDAPPPGPAPGPAGGTEPETGAPVEPPPPALDAEAQRRHDEEVAKWIGTLKDPNTAVAYSAAFKLKQLKDPKAVPALVEALRGHKDLWVRAESATALGAIRSADAVPALIEAIDDKEPYVFTSASDALVRMTGQDFKNFPLDPASKKERKAYKDQWLKWWKDNEAELRRRLAATTKS